MVIPGYTYTPDTISLGGMTYRSDAYKKVNGDGSTVIKLYYMPKEYTLNLSLKLGASDAHWNLNYNGGGAEFLRNIDANDIAGRVVRSKEDIFLPSTAIASRDGYLLKGWYIGVEGVTLKGQASIDFYNDLATRIDQLRADSEFGGELTDWEYTTPESDVNVTLYAVWVAQNSHFSIEHYKVIDGNVPANPAYVDTDPNYQYATGDNVTLSEVTRLWGSPIVDTTATFSDGGTIYDFRGYTFDATDALGVAVWTAEVLGDGSTVLKLYYTSNTDTDYVLEHYLVTGAPAPSRATARSTSSISRASPTR